MLRNNSNKYAIIKKWISRQKMVNFISTRLWRQFLEQIVRYIIETVGLSVQIKRRQWP